MTVEPTARFSDRASDYLLYRPRYPRAIVDLLAAKGLLTPHSTIADLGSGTGFLSELFLEHGCTVHGVEPNQAMRTAGEQHLVRFRSFHSVAATAEATTLPDASIDIVTAGQAMHWFDPQPTLAEIRRITRAPHWFVIVANDRALDASDFMREYEKLLTDLLPEYISVRARYHSLHNWLDDPSRVQSAEFRNHQIFDEAGLIGRVLSSSYAPKEGTDHANLIAGLKSLFARHQQYGSVTFHYRTFVEWAAVG